MDKRIDPELVARASYFLSYASDKRAPDLVLMERFKLDRNTARQIAREIEKGGANAAA